MHVFSSAELRGGSNPSSASNAGITTTASVDVFFNQAIRRFREVYRLSEGTKSTSSPK